MLKTEFTLIVTHGHVISKRDLQANLTRVMNRYRQVAGIKSARIVRRRPWAARKAG